MDYDIEETSDQEPKCGERRTEGPGRCAEYTPKFGHLMACITLGARALNDLSHFEDW